MITKHFQSRGYHIIDHKENIDAIAQFVYRGYQVSMSTIGRSHGGCMQPVNIYKQDTSDEYDKLVGGDFHTVNDAIEYINALTVPKKPKKS